MVVATAKMQKRLFHCVYDINYHLVVVTKYRQKVLSPEIHKRLCEIAHERAGAWGGEISEINGEPDHLHMLISLPPKHAISDFVIAFKTSTAKLIRKEFAAHTKKYFWKEKGILWSRSYFVASCGGAPLEKIKLYIQSQELAPQ